MQHLYPKTIALALCALSTGCASITTGQNQSLSVETLADGSKVSGASCRLENDKGIWYVTAPGTTVVRRSYNDLNVRCEKDGHEPGVTAARSSTKAMAFGNILFGGVIGAAVDVGSGAAYDYPSIIAVELGRNRVQTPDLPTDGRPQPGMDGTPSSATISANTRTNTSPLTD